MPNGDPRKKFREAFRPSQVRVFYRLEGEVFSSKQGNQMDKTVPPGAAIPLDILEWTAALAAVVFVAALVATLLS